MSEMAQKINSTEFVTFVLFDNFNKTNIKVYSL